MTDPLIACLVHDLKNPINAIDLLAQTMLLDRADHERARTAATRIRDEARVLLRMVSSLLDVGGAAEHGLVPALREVDPHALVRGVLDELRARAHGTGVTLAAELALDAWVVDPDLMRRVLANLVDNAIRYAPEGSWVEIAVWRTPDGVDLRVADEGPGVPPHLREAVFDAFNRCGARPSRANHGLGLTFCKLAVEAHGGRIWIEDRSPGAVFCVRIPEPGTVP